MAVGDIHYALEGNGTLSVSVDQHRVGDGREAMEEYQRNVLYLEDVGITLDRNGVAKVPADKVPEVLQSFKKERVNPGCMAAVCQALSAQGKEGLVATLEKIAPANQLGG